MLFILTVWRRGSPVLLTTNEPILDIVITLQFVRACFERGELNADFGVSNRVRARVRVKVRADTTVTVKQT